MDPAQMDPAQDGRREMPFHGNRVAFFGGSFDPPHMGHLAVARAAHAALDVDTVLFAPVGAQPLKPQGSTAGFEDRLAMTQLAIAGNAGFEVSTVDAPRPGAAPNYTLETLERLRSELPAGTELFCLMGADSFFGLRHWHRAAEIPFAAALIVASRPGQALSYLEAALPAGITLTDCEDHRKDDVDLRSCRLSAAAGRRAPFFLLPGLDVEISASAIRTQLRTQLSAEPLAPGILPPAVRDYIASHRLYIGA
jgi:nicotinate-nucleotide adenylyltransferase